MKKNLVLLVVVFLALIGAMALVNQEAHAQEGVPLYQAPSDADPLWDTTFDHFGDAIYVTEVPTSALSGAEKNGFVEVRSGSVLTTIWTTTVTLTLPVWIPVDATYDVVTLDEMNLKKIEEISATIASDLETFMARKPAELSFMEWDEMAKLGHILLTISDEELVAWAKTLNFQFVIPTWSSDGLTLASMTVGQAFGQTPPAKATPAPAPAAPASAAPAKMPAFVSDVSHGKWKIQGTSRLKDNPIVEGWLARLKDPRPDLWVNFPNVENRTCLPGFDVANGLEYGTYDSPYCSSHPCDIPVGAWEYRYISGDYSYQGTVCKATATRGCMLVLVNVGKVSYTWRNQDVDNGFTLRGRFWNGDALEWGVWGLVSHGSANMLNMPTQSRPGEVLNAGGPGNSGANCSSPNGCGSVDVTVVVQAGDAILAVAKTTVTK